MNATARDEAGMLESNRRFYNKLWREAKLIEPQRFNTWPLVSALCAASTRRLEIAPGLRPRLPLPDSVFVDLSTPALCALRKRGANAINGVIGALPFKDSSFDFVCAFDIIEHVADDDAALTELSRVAAHGTILLLSVPLHPQAWTAFDDFVGHCRRYEPAAILAKLATCGFKVERSAIYGMQPQSSALLDLGMWFLNHHRSVAMNWYNRVFMPIGLRMQKPLHVLPGVIDTQGVDEVLLVCRKVDTVQ